MDEDIEPQRMNIVDAFLIDDGELDGMDVVRAFTLGVEYALARATLLDEAKWSLGRQGVTIHEENIARLKAVAEKRRMRVVFEAVSEGGFYTMRIKDSDA